MISLITEHEKLNAMKYHLNGKALSFFNSLDENKQNEIVNEWWIDVERFPNFIRDVTEFANDTSQFVCEYPFKTEFNKLLK